MGFKTDLTQKEDSDSDSSDSDDSNSHPEKPQFSIGRGKTGVQTTV